MTERTAASGWAREAIGLARRATRRARAAHVLLGAAAGTTLGAIAGAAVRTLARGTPRDALLLAGAGGLLGLLAGLRSARRVPATSVGAAAWAMDRKAGAGERGLTLALADPDSPAARAVSLDAPEPPRLRLAPPRGIGPFAAAVLLAGLVAAAPVKAARTAGPISGASDARPGGAEAAIDAGRRESDAVDAERASAAVRKVRDALRLPATGTLEPEEIAARLRDPAARSEARAAAEPGSAAAAALADPQDGSAGAALARALQNDGSDRAEALRREAAALRAAGGSLPVPPSRRALVARYFARLHEARPEDAPR